MYTPSVESLQTLSLKLQHNGTHVVFSKINYNRLVDETYVIKIGDYVIKIGDDVL